MSSLYLILLCMFIGASNTSCTEDNDFQDPDYWITSSPESQQVDPSLLEKLETEISNMDEVYSFLMIKDGYLISENYYNGKDKSSLLHLRSISKSITGMLTGIALDQNVISDTNKSITGFLPQLKDANSWNSVHVYHLLNMLSGMEWDEDSDILPWLDNLYSPIDFYKERNITQTPGTNFNYNTAAVHLLSLVLKEASGESIESMAQKRLFSPLGISRWTWEKDKVGNPRGGTGISLRSRDIAKLGQLYIQEGIWENKQVISSSWVYNSWFDPIDLAQYNPSYNLDFKNLWWSYDFEGYKVRYAEGYGGQILAILPDVDLVVVINREPFTSFENAAARRQEFFKVVLPGITDAIRF